MQQQHTLADTVTCQGIGLHTGQTITMTIIPAAENTGILFKRIDITDGDNIIPATYDNVTETMLGTVISNAAGVRVSTIEHLMAAFWGMGIDNAIVELDGEEVTVMDGSSVSFTECFAQIGVVAQHALRNVIEITKEIRIEEKGKWISIAPASRFEVALDIDFPHEAIGKQHFHFNDAMSFREKLAEARTFGFEHEVEQMRAMGLARGGSLENAIVIGKEGILNEDGLRFNDEFVRHKVLDAIGDIFLAGATIQGKVTGYCSGHDLNNKLLRALFADNTAWKLHTPTSHHGETAQSNTHIYLNTNNDDTASLAFPG